jgi:NAD kinase
MQNQVVETAIIVRSKTRLEQLTERFNTIDQAKFYIAQSKANFMMKKAKAEVQIQSKLSVPQQVRSEIQAPSAKESEREFKPYEEEHKQFYTSFEKVKKELEGILKIKVLEQEFLSTYIFSQKEIVIVLGQDGLVANTAKYVHGLPIIAVNPDKSRYDGVLLHFTPDNFMPKVQEVLSGNFQAEHITMAEVVLNDEQKLLAFNDLFIGVSSHASARYRLELNGTSENQSSSGVIVSTGAGSTGWLSSLFNMANGMIRTFSAETPIPVQNVSKDYPNLFFVVREPFVSKHSSANIVAGQLSEGQILTIESQIPQNGVIFSDGIQTDFLKFNSGTIAEIGIAKEKAVLVM